MNSCLVLIGVVEGHDDGSIDDNGLIDDDSSIDGDGLIDDDDSVDEYWSAWRCWVVVKEKKIVGARTLVVLPSVWPLTYYIIFYPYPALHYTYLCHLRAP